MTPANKTINLWYVRGLRAKEGSPEPHPKLVSVAEYINERYQSAGIPLNVSLRDMDTYVRGLSQSELEQITKKQGERDELIELIQTPISQEECRKRQGIERRNGVWYYKDPNGECLEVELKHFITDLQEDPENFRFRKDFVAVMERKYQYDHEEIKKLAKGICNGDEKVLFALSAPLLEVKYGSKTSILTAAEILIEDYVEFRFRKEEGRQKYRQLSDEFYLGDSLGDAKNNIRTVDDQLALYINSIQDIKLRKKYFERLKYILKEETFTTHNQSKRAIRVNFSERPESYYGSYELLDNLDLPLKVEDDFNHRLSDRIVPSFLIDEKLIYQFARSYYGKGGYSSVLLDLSDAKIAFLIMHELTHKITGIDDESKPHPELDDNLMNTPIYYEDINDEDVRKKMSNGSLRRAYMIGDSLRKAVDKHTIG